MPEAAAEVSPQKLLLRREKPPPPFLEPEKPDRELQKKRFVGNVCSLAELMQKKSQDRVEIVEEKKEDVGRKAAKHTGEMPLPVRRQAAQEVMSGKGLKPVRTVIAQDESTRSSEVIHKKRLSVICEIGKRTKGFEDFFKTALRALREKHPDMLVHHFSIDFRGLTLYAPLTVKELFQKKKLEPVQHLPFPLYENWGIHLPRLTHDPDMNQLMICWDMQSKIDPPDPEVGLAISSVSRATNLYDNPGYLYHNQERIYLG